MDLQTFLNSLRDLESDDKLIDYCRKYVLHGTPYIFLNREDEYYEFRKRIANKFKVAFNEVFITGSAKMGFSPFKEKQFDYDSDIDVAIVSNRLYEEILESIRRYQMNKRQYRRKLSTSEVELYHDFLEYVAMGWIRPDKLPLAFQIKDFKDDWFDFFKSISYNQSEVGNYKVSAGVFKSYFYLEEYTISGLRDLKNSLTIKKYEYENAN
jgi:predicted nucleotidyltransferase